MKNSSVTQNGPWRDNMTLSGEIPVAAALVANFCTTLKIVPIQVTYGQNSPPFDIS